MRNHNTDVNGKPFGTLRQLAVWQKGNPISRYDLKNWRSDIYGNPIKYSEYGNTKSCYGWEIDHIIPVASEGTDDLFNLQPLQWRKNREKGDKL